MVIAGCHKDQKPASDAGLTPPPPPSTVMPAPEPINPSMVTPPPAVPVTPPPAEKVTPAKPAHVAKTDSATTHKKKTYVVVKGDNLTKIAKHFNTTVSKLMKANPKIKPDGKILVGQKIIIP
jgi:LysM repeat protein